MESKGTKIQVLVRQGKRGIRVRAVEVLLCMPGYSRPLMHFDQGLFCWHTNLWIPTSLGFCFWQAVNCSISLGKNHFVIAISRIC